MVERCVRDAEAACSNHVASILVKMLYACDGRCSKKSERTESDCPFGFFIFCRGFDLTGKGFAVFTKVRNCPLDGFTHGGAFAAGNIMIAPVYRQQDFISFALANGGGH